MIAGTTPETLFLGACIPVRLGLAWFVFRHPGKKRAYPLQFTLVLIGLGLTFLGVVGWRSTGWETGGRPIWWKHWRWFHGLLYLLAAYLVSLGNWRGAGMLLILDAAFAFVAASDQRRWYVCPMSKTKQSDATRIRPVLA